MAGTPGSPAVLIEAAGLDTSKTAVVAFAPLVDNTTCALVTGRVFGTGVEALGYFAIRAEVGLTDADTGEPLVWHAVAFVSANPSLPVNGLTMEEQERLRAESQIIQGGAKPVGQEAVIGKSDAVPYAPPLPARDYEYHPPIQVEEIRDVTDVKPAACGGSKCVSLAGEESHDATTCPLLT